MHQPSEASATWCFRGTSSLRGLLGACGLGPGAPRVVQAQVCPACPTGSSEGGQGALARPPASRCALARFLLMMGVLFCCGAGFFIRRRMYPPPLIEEPAFNVSYTRQPPTPAPGQPSPPSLSVLPAVSMSPASFWKGHCHGCTGRKTVFTQVLQLSLTSCLCR